MAFFMVSTGTNSARSAGRADLSATLAVRNGRRVVKYRRLVATNDEMVMKFKAFDHECLAVPCFNIDNSGDASNDREVVFGLE